MTGKHQHNGRSRDFWRIHVAGLILLLLFSFQGYSQTPSREYQLKAAFLFNFTQFINWPSQAFAHPGAPFVIGIYGTNPFGNYLQEVVAGETVNNRRIVVRNIQNLREAANCHILFTTSVAAERLHSLRNLPVLTVGDQGGFARKGGIIEFFNENNKIRLRVNVEAAKTARVEISSKLLRLAEQTE